MLTVTGLAVIAVALSTILKQKNPEFSLMISLLTGILILGMSFPQAFRFLSGIEALFAKDRRTRRICTNSF